MRVRSGHVWSEFETLLATSLNEMLDEASADQMVTADLAAGYRLLDVASAEPAATNGYPWIDDQNQLRFGNGSYFQYGSGVTRLTNKSGGALTRGTVVRIDHANQDAMVKTGTNSASVSDGRVFGVVLDTSVADNAAGFVLYRGHAYVDVLSTSASDPSASLAGSYVYAFGSFSPGKAQVITPGVAQSEPFALFAVYLEPDTGLSFSAGLKLCRVMK